MTESIEARVLDWIEKTGYPLEMRAGNAFHGSRFGITHSEVYADPVTGDSREIDLVAYARDSTGKFSMHFIVECKSCDKPWVIFKGQDLDYVDNPEWLYALSKLARSAPTDSQDHVSAYYSAFGLMAGGHSLRLAFSGQNDAAYSACISVLKASVAMSFFFSDLISISVPIIVVDSAIFEYEHFPNGEFQLKEVSSSAVKFGAFLDEYRHTLIRVVSIGELPNLVKKLDSLFDLNNNVYLEFARRVAKKGA